MIRYGGSFVSARFPTSGNAISTLGPKPSPELRVAKIHRSTNWLYCDNCRNVYWFNPQESLRIADQILSKDDWRCIAPKSPANAKCDGKTASLVYGPVRGKESGAELRFGATK